NGSNQLTNELHQTWNTTTSAWDNSSQLNYTYNGDGTIAQIVTQDWNGTSWDNTTLITVHYNSCILPITLLDFSGAVNGKDVQLKWSSGYEINSKNFVVQRSTDGTHFINVGTVATNNTMQKSSYQFTDVNAVQNGNTKLYYRLQMNDKDGQQAYSKIIAINI